MIEVSHLTKRFGRTVAVDDISFSVRRGEIVGFLGPNGAGKTTTMRMLACFFPPTSGRVEIAGRDASTSPLEVRERIGYVPENVALYPDMRAKEYLAYRGRLKGMSGRRLRGAIDEVSERCGIGEVRHRIIGQLSRGFRQRVGLADALLHEPDLLILDEPTIGLDPNQIRQVRTLVRGLAERHTVLLSSHLLPEVESVCRRVLILDRGRIVASDTPERLAALLKGKRRLVLETNGPQGAVREVLAGLAGVQVIRAEAVGEWTRCVCECDGDARAAVSGRMAGNGWNVRELTLERRNLEDVFVALTASQTDLEESADEALRGETS